MISAADLHEAADEMPEMSDYVATCDQLGLEPDALSSFVHNATFRAPWMVGAPALPMDPLALAVGIAIGILAEREQ